MVVLFVGCGCVAETRKNVLFLRGKSTEGQLAVKLLSSIEKQKMYVTHLVFLPVSMNSWFWYEFMVCSMGPISANIADNQVKIDYGM
jgi:hypothetical protein